MLEIRRWNAAVGRVVACATALLALLALAGAAWERTPPTALTNLRVTQKTSYSVSLAWDASRDRSGIAYYLICCDYPNNMTV